jgi:hypothetical protein
MKRLLLVVVAAGAGALTMLAIPTSFVSTASGELREIRLVDLNPFRAIFDSGQRQIRAGMTPEQLGLHPSVVNVSPMTLPPPASLKLDLGRAFEDQAESQIQQNDRRMQDMQAYTRNPSQWSGPRPH